MSTILYISGYCSFHSTSLTQTFLGGPQTLLQQLGDTSTPKVDSVLYNDWDILGGAQDGANQIAAKINALPAAEKIVVVAHSYGAVAATLLTNNPAQLKHDPSLLTFVNLGNSLRANTGYWTLNHGYGTPGPTSTTHKIIDVCREFDRYGDVPNVTTSPYYNQAVTNMNAGDSQSPFSIHLGYQNIRLDQPHAETTIGTVRFLLYETDPMPNASGLTRAQIASAYQRVVAPNW